VDLRPNSFAMKSPTGDSYRSSNPVSCEGFGGNRGSRAELLCLQWFCNMSFSLIYMRACLSRASLLSSFTLCYLIISRGLVRVPCWWLLAGVEDGKQPVCQGETRKINDASASFCVAMSYEVQTRSKSCADQFLFLPGTFTMDPIQRL
jgi:hypothetical protein